ncbi:MAG: hypothetical protein F4Y03_07795 [Alphaproteobacteria bacterium]|nr:hypothetical protein [Alphaproteobacteria bacterium]
MSDQDATGRPGGGNTPRHPYMTGCRIHKPEFDRARDAAEAWTGHEGGLDHWALLDLLRADGVAARFGLTPRHIDYLRACFKKLCREDFEPGDCPPTVWMTKEKLATKAHVTSPRLVSAIEKDLAAAGFIYWSDTASRRRSGERSKHDGRIRWAYGVDFSPFATMAQEIENTARLVEEEQTERKGLIHEIATIRCHTRILLQAALRCERAPAEAIRPLLDQVLALPAAKGMQSADVHALRGLAEDARLFQEHALTLTEPPQTALEEPPAKETQGSDPASPEGENGAENCTPGYDFRPGSNSITHQFQEITLGAAGPPTEPPQEPQQPPAAHLRPEREAGSPSSLGRAPVSGGPPAWLILDSLSPRLSRFLPAGRPPTADEFFQAANGTRSELGISPEAWREACTALSPAWASMAVVVVTSRDDAGEIHTSAGGFFRTLTDRARLGTLNLAGSLWGVIERHEKLHVARVTGPTDGEHSVPGPDSHPRIAPSRIDRQRADQPTMTAILRTAEDPKGLALAWRDLVARYRCWPFVDEVERHYAQIRKGPQT